MATEYGFGRVSTNGLVFVSDSADRNSYRGTGTSWLDVSGNAMVGTINNSPTFNTSNGGYFDFDGTDEYVLFTNNTILDTQTPTVEIWIKTNATTQNAIWFEKGIVNQQYSLFQENTTLKWRHALGGINNLEITTATYITTTKWHQVVGTFTSGDRRLFVNGVQVGADTPTGTIGTNTTGVWLGGRGNLASYSFNGSISICRVYNRVLSASEIVQNYNATKARFGL